MSLTWGSVSGWWLPLCVVLGLLYAWLMYRKPVQLQKSFRYGLFALRAIVVSLLALLLLSPLIKSVTYQPQKPLILIAQDNSESIKLFRGQNKVSPDGGDLEGANSLLALQKQLGDDYEVHAFNFDKDLKDGLSNTFNGKQTNISGALKQLNDRFVNQNIGAVVLATDGLYNTGADPSYEAKNIRSGIYTIAMGNTTARKDVLISNVSYNKTAFLGNDFEIEVSVEAYQSKGGRSQLSVIEDGRNVHQQNIDINSDVFRKTIPVKLSADKKGIRKFVISLSHLDNELSYDNNTETIYVEVLDARQKILLVYDAPHPDITVLKQAIESNRNFEVKTTLTSDIAKLKPADYTLAILYQLQAGSYAKLQAITQNKMPLWFVAGTQADLQDLNNHQKVLGVSATRAESQEVFAQVVPGFSAFTLSDSTRSKLEKLPPLLAPYGSYKTGNGAQILLKQKIGNVATDYPLLAFGDDGGRKVAVLSGEGLWRWQLAEYREYGNHSATEELLSQAVQYLTANANRQRFRVYAAKNIFDEGENVLLNAELYNDALELVNTPDVKINLKDQAGKNFSFLFTRSGQSYQLNAGTLPVGTYAWSASATLGKQAFKADGQLTVKPLNLEARQSAADHQLLRQMAQQSGGKMLYPSQINQLADLIKKNENIKTVVYEDKRYNDLIDMKWVFFLLLALASVEWFLRKRAGEV
ncbi:hypothetical protein D0C36_06810 [Mucilaginibacter conchicola]|uniref:VWA domain-containing protein n=1 Tax=Mucilaginibacter conchicola TaxID=2303333 RepID=A0A372NZA3_9SPHI|nr:hypothetical protein [Mucilaginibacter conchicola]RFZ95231.1 hypothetical protein D0C36_06810 [Mucilaginibacter conchicola]